MKAFKITLLICFWVAVVFGLFYGKNPYAIANRAILGIRYSSDMERVGHQEWTSPYETRKRGYGDCEEFVALAMEKLVRAGYDPYMAIGDLASTGESHAVLFIDGTLYDPRTKRKLPESYFNNLKYFKWSWVKSKF